MLRVAECELLLDGVSLAVGECEVLRVRVGVPGGVLVGVPVGVCVAWRDRVADSETVGVTVHGAPVYSQQPVMRFAITNWPGQLAGGHGGEPVGSYLGHVPSTRHKFAVHWPSCGVFTISDGS